MNKPTDAALQDIFYTNIKTMMRSFDTAPGRGQG